MCARYTLTAEEKEILKNNPYQLVGAYEPDANIAVTDGGLVITSDEPDIIQQMSFGIVPHTASSNVLTFDTWNIRSEEVMEKKTYAPLMKHRKTCLIIADSFYEWQKITDTDKRPYRFTNERKTFCFAGLWSQWVNPETGEKYRTFGIMTTEANKTVGEIHDKQRMPVILHRNEELRWLNKKLTVEQLLEMCKPYPDHLMSRTQVSKKVNKVSTKKSPNKGLDLIKPYNELIIPTLFD